MVDEEANSTSILQDRGFVGFLIRYIVLMLSGAFDVIRLFGIHTEDNPFNSGVKDPCIRRDRK